CQITMNPLGNGAAMASAPVISSTPNEAPSTTEGSGWLDTIKDIWNKGVKFAKEHKLLSRGLKYVPTVGPALSTAADMLGFGSIPMKRGREDVSGGAIMGLGDFC
ncbi:hypothetical protein ACQUW0_26655, partial [Ralstonia pseudosolanacearum]|uniref:hypothetical protein n=1 Tax=Ralstonia pseudosolanacearum TaxID=1310165 RepID=UPI003D17A08E